MRWLHVRFNIIFHLRTEWLISFYDCLGKRKETKWMWNTPAGLSSFIHPMLCFFSGPYFLSKASDSSWQFLCTTICESIYIKKKFHMFPFDWKMASHAVGSLIPQLCVVHACPQRHSSIDCSLLFNTQLLLPSPSEEVFHVNLWKATGTVHTERNGFVQHQRW